MKLEGCQENFKVTLLERPPKKSCSTSTFSREISLQIFSPTFLKRFPCKLSKPSKSSKLSKISRQQATQAFQAYQASQANRIQTANLLANYPLLQTTTPRASHTGRDEEGTKSFFKIAESRICCSLDSLS